MSDTFSHSRLTLLDDCPRRYRFRYVEKRPEAFTTAEAFMGTMVHEALQAAYLQREESAAPSEESVVARYREAFARGAGSHVRVVQEGGRLESFRDEGEAMLRRHLRGTFAEDRLETLAVEPQVRVEIVAAAPGGEEPAGTRTYVGYIDRLARDRDGTLHVIDYKTSKRIPESAGQAGLQLRGYGLGVFEKHGGVEVGLRWEYLRHDRALVETMPRSLGGEVATELGRRIGRALQAERQGDFPARPSNLCRWCGYREDCDASPFFAAPGESAAHGEASPPAVAGRQGGESRGPGTRTGDRDAAPGDACCPICASALRRRSSSRGELVACARYPDCSFAREG